MSQKISPGDLVRRKYHISQPSWRYTEMGLVLDRDNNGVLDVIWGSKIESMWDDYDLVRVESPEEI